MPSLRKELPRYAHSNSLKVSDWKSLQPIETRDKLWNICHDIQSNLNHVYERLTLCYVHNGGP